MFRKVLLTAALLAVAVAPLAASAGEVDNRVNREQARINQGVGSGQLTHGEYNRVESRQDRINASRERDLNRDGGHLTNFQRANLNRRQNNLSRSIYFDKHNVNRQR